jgi:Glycosyltransferase family 87
MSVAFVRRHARSLGLLTFTVLAFAWFARTWVDPFHRQAGTAGDPQAGIFSLAWPPYAVTHLMNPSYTTYLLAPKGANLMWTSPPGFGLLLWPLIAIVGPLVTYNLLATLSLAVSGWTAQLALRRFVPGELGPFVGGMFYGFSPYMAAHSLGHPALTLAIMPPLLLLLLHETFVRQRWRPGVTGLAIGALVAVQLVTFLELIAGSAVAVGLLIVVLAVVYREQIRARFRYVVVTAAVALVTFLVLDAGPLWTLVFGQRSLIHSHTLIHPQNQNVTDLFGFVVPWKYQLFNPPALRSISGHFSTGGAEINGYVGVPLLIICVVIAVKHWRSRTVRIASFMTLAMALLSMGPRLQIRGWSTIPLPWSLIAHLPLMANLLPVRLSVFTDLGIAFLLSYGIAHRVRPATRNRQIGRAAAAAAVVLTLLPSFYLLRVLWAPINVPPYFTSALVKKIPEGSIALVAPWTTDPSNVEPQVWQVASGFRFKLASGYAFVPVGDDGLVTSGLLTDDLEAAMWRIPQGIDPPNIKRPHVRDHFRQLVKQHQIETVIVGPMPRQDAMLRFLTVILGRPPERSGGVYVWYRVGRQKP